MPVVVVIFATAVVRGRGGGRVDGHPRRRTGRHARGKERCPAVVAAIRLLNASGRPTTRRDYEKALEAIKLLTENVTREPLKAFGKQ